MLYWFLAAASLAGCVASIALLVGRSRLAPLFMLLTGVGAFSFFARAPHLLIYGSIASLLVAELGLLSYVLRIRAEDDKHQARRRRRIGPPLVRVHPASYHLSDSGVWRLHRPVEYLSESGVWRRKASARA